MKTAAEVVEETIIDFGRHVDPRDRQLLAEAIVNRLARRAGEEHQCPCCGDWFSLCGDAEHTNEAGMCAFCATGQHSLDDPCRPQEVRHGR